MTRVTFLLPGSGHRPSGGFKVVYEYANGLVARGYDVSLVHAEFSALLTPLWKRPLKLGRYYYRRLGHSYLPAHWFPVDPRVDIRWAPSLHAKYIPDSDYIVATAWHTAEAAARYGADKGRKLYLIQHLETWDGTEAAVMATWRLPLRKIVIARWLEDIAMQMGETAEYIPNGLDHAAFGLDTPIAQRDPCQVVMLAHRYPWKGTQDALQALQMVKTSAPQLRAALFGIFPPERSALPEWITFHHTPSQQQLRALYNTAAIGVAPSWSEGWGLPATEAMMCGAALAATDIGGHREFARPEDTALLSPPRHPDALARNIRRLIDDQPLRLQLAQQGHDYVRQFTWPRALDRFEAVLRSMRQETV